MANNYAKYYVNYHLLSFQYYLNSFKRVQILHITKHLVS